MFMHPEVEYEVIKAHQQEIWGAAQRVRRAKEATTERQRHAGRESRRVNDTLFSAVRWLKALG